MHKIFLIAPLALAACVQAKTTEVSATEATICREIGATLPTRSRKDTPETIEGIGVHYNVFEAVCPSHADLIP